MRCVPRASNGPNHLGLCAIQERQQVPTLFPVLFGFSPLVITVLLQAKQMMAEYYHYA